MSDKAENALDRIEKALNYLGSYTVGVPPKFSDINELLLLVQDDLSLLRNLVKAAMENSELHSEYTPCNCSLCKAVRAFEESHD